MTRLTSGSARFSRTSALKHELLVLLSEATGLAQERLDRVALGLDYPFFIHRLRVSGARPDGQVVAELSIDIDWHRLELTAASGIDLLSDASVAQETVALNTASRAFLDAVADEDLSVHLTTTYGPHVDRSVVDRLLGLVPARATSFPTDSGSTLVDPKPGSGQASRTDVAHQVHSETDEVSMTDEFFAAAFADPDTLRARNNLASAYQDQGRTSEAVALLHRNLADSERVLGPDHPDTLRTRNNLASAYQDQGRTSEAVALLHQNLADSERVLGPDHPDTLRTRNNLASAYQDQGRTSEAVALLHQNLADSERVLGPDHLTTIASRNNLASAYQSEGRLTDAITLLQQNLADSERMLGPDHPDTLRTRNNLASAYQSVGRLADAITLLQENIAASRLFPGAEYGDGSDARDDDPFREGSR